MKLELAVGFAIVILALAVLVVLVAVSRSIVERIHRSGPESEDRDGQ